MNTEQKDDKTSKDWNMQMWLGQEAYARGMYAAAREKFQKALIDLEKLQIRDERLTMTLNNLALCFCAQGKHKEADPLYKRALTIDETSGSAGNLNLAEDLSNIATHYRKQGLNAQAEPLYHRALKLWQDELGEHSAEVAGCLNNLAVLFCEQDRCHEAIALYKKALSIKGSIFGTKSKEYAGTLVNLASAYCSLNKCEEADPLFEEGIRTLQYTMDPIHHELIEALESYVTHLRKTGQTEKAAQVASDIVRFEKRNKSHF
jgi:tetratricopeptide (TPR) repeat protein